ncbi:uncharacterized protein LOC128422486 [Podarcis raffonei]|uniref:uncharacterized protein LOC128422486 n=1 Tax=Podarcis raffonei TaxID=65483 RepID=UPI0023294A12|nr:uncharacterized protein LOC128422486 [Podarcis raffonei]
MRQKIHAVKGILQVPNEIREQPPSQDFRLNKVLVKVQSPFHPSPCNGCSPNIHPGFHRAQFKNATKRSHVCPLSREQERLSPAHAEKEALAAAAAAAPFLTYLQTRFLKEPPSDPPSGPGGKLQLYRTCIAYKSQIRLQHPVVPRRARGRAPRARPHVPVPGPLLSAEGPSRRQPPSPPRARRKSSLPHLPQARERCYDPGQARPLEAPGRAVKGGEEKRQTPSNAEPLRRGRGRSSSWRASSARCGAAVPTPPSPGELLFPPLPGGASGRVGILPGELKSHPGRRQKPESERLAERRAGKECGARLRLAPLLPLLPLASLHSFLRAGERAPAGRGGKKAAASICWPLSPSSVCLLLWRSLDSQFKCHEHCMEENTENASLWRHFSLPDGSAWSTRVPPHPSQRSDPIVLPQVRSAKVCRMQIEYRLQFLLSKSNIKLC